jgi:hypothetical protein
MQYADGLFCGNALAMDQTKPKRWLFATAALDTKARTALGATTGQNFTAIGSFHAGTESVIAFTLQIAGLVSTFGSHDGTSIKWVCSEPVIIEASATLSQVSSCLADRLQQARLDGQASYPQKI